MFSITTARYAARAAASPAVSAIAVRHQSGRLVTSPYNAIGAQKTHFSTVHGGDPDVLESEKARNLSGTQHHTSTPHPDQAPGWNEHLASTSEAHVKADKNTNTPEELQRSTIDYVHKRHHPEEVLERRESYAQRDEVTGPLGTKHVEVLQEETIQKGTRDTSKFSKPETSVEADRGEL